jgi:3-oxoacyl-(acyl-carrier-protein) synthase
MECRIIAPPAVPPFDPTRLRHRKLLKVMDSRTRDLIAAAQAAADAAGLTHPAGPRCAIGVGLAHSSLGRENWTPDPAALPPLWMLEWLPNMPAAHLALQLGAGGPTHTFAAPESALWDEALELARSWLASGEADCVLAASAGAGAPRAAVIRPA